MNLCVAVPAGSSPTDAPWGLRLNTKDDEQFEPARRRVLAGQNANKRRSAAALENDQPFARGFTAGVVRRVLGCATAFPALSAGRLPG